MADNSFKRLVVPVLRLLGAAAAIGLVVWLVDVRTVFNALSTLPMWVVVAGAVIYFLRTWLLAVRWRLLTSGAQPRLGRWQFFRLTALRAPLNVSLPSTVGGDLARSAYVMREAGKDAASHILALFQNRVVGFVGLVVLGLGTSFLLPAFPGRLDVQLTLAGLFFALAGFHWVLLADRPRRLFEGLLTTWPRLEERIRPYLAKLDQSRRFWREETGRFMSALAMNLPIHLSLVFFVYLVAGALGLDLGFWVLCPITCLVIIVSGLPISFGGIGVRELSFVFLLGRLDVPPEAATALSLAQTGLYLLMAIVCAPLLSMGSSRETSTARSSRED